MSLRSQLKQLLDEATHKWYLQIGSDHAEHWGGIKGDYIANVRYGVYKDNCPRHWKHYNEYTLLCPNTFSQTRYKAFLAAINVALSSNKLTNEDMRLSLIQMKNVLTQLICC